MLPSAQTQLVRRGLSRHLFAALLFAAGCSGSGASCGSSCGGGVLTTTLPDGGPFKYTGAKLDNTVQVRITQDGFNLLNANTLNQVIGSLGDGGTNIATIPCQSFPVFSCSSDFNATQLKLVAGDSNFNAQCDSTDGAPLSIKFNNVTWTLDPVHQVLKAKVFVNIKSGDYYLRTAEAHSSLVKDDNNAPAPIQADLQIDDSETLAGQTELDVDLEFTKSPDGRLLIQPTTASLDAILQGVDVTGMIHIAAQPGNNPAPPTNGFVDGFDGCDPDAQTYLTMTNAVVIGLGNPRLTGSAWTLGFGASCTPDSTSESGLGCQIFQTIEGYLESFLKTTFQTQIVAFLQQQIDNIVCVRGSDSTGAAVACDSGHPCPVDDNGTQLTCDPGGKGVCLATGQTYPFCEPVPLALQGKLDLTALTQTVGFPAGTALNLYAGLGGKTAPANIDDAGVQLTAVSGTQPASTVVPALCVPPTTFPVLTAPIPPLNFNDTANQPDGGIGTYDVGLALAGPMLNQASYDAFNAGVFCIEISDKTSSYVSTQLFKTFLPSLNLLTGGRDAPMAILLRPTAQPSVRVGRGTFEENDAGTGLIPNDPLVTLTLPKLNLDFYAVIDERWVRLFTLETDVAVPLGLRTFAGTQADTLQPVLGDLTQVITNISAKDNVLLAEDPSVVTDLLGAVIQFAQPLLAGILKPIALPQLLGLQLQVKGIGGAVPVSSNIQQDGYNHLAIWAAISTCGGAGQPTCPNLVTTHTEARLVESVLPSSADEIRTLHKIPTAVIEASATGMANNGRAEFSYRIDSGLWSPWLQSPRITIKNPMFLVQGHHNIEITSRTAGDDRSQDMSPVSVDFLSSFEAPRVELLQLNDGRVITRARSQANTAEQMKYSYRIGDGAWSEASLQREFSAEELGGHSLGVRVTDERGFTAESLFNSGAELTAPEAASSLKAAGCSTLPGAPAWSLLPLGIVGLVLAVRRRRS